MQPLLVPITSTQIEEERATVVRTTQAHPCRNDCPGMNTKDEVQFSRSKNLSLSSVFAPKLQQQVTSREDRGGRKKPGGNDRGTLGREGWRQKDVRKREREKGVA